MEQDENDNNESNEYNTSDDDPKNIIRDTHKMEEELDILLSQLKTSIVSHNNNTIDTDDIKGDMTNNKIIHRSSSLVFDSGIKTDDKMHAVRISSRITLGEHRCRCGILFLREDAYEDHQNVCDGPKRPPPPLPIFRRGSPRLDRITRTSFVNFRSEVIDNSDIKIVIPILGNKNEKCICRKCNKVFNNDKDYIGHVCSNNLSDGIPIDVGGPIVCQICENKYADEFLLGEHFTISHNDYENMEKLDEKMMHGFPGFKILKYIKVIKGLSTRRKHMFMENNEKCGICDIEYYGNDIDSDIDTSPIKMTCCKNFICKNCVKSYMSISDSLLCPYCLFDHTQTNKTFIIFIDMCETIDKKRWIDWWHRHIDIFL
jgi:uncharacterized C2H2 Zn-finger protein